MCETNTQPVQVLALVLQVNPKELVLVDSTCRNLRRLALAVASQKAVLLEGPIGCGKTALVEFMAAVTGHTTASEILKVQLGDQTDSKVTHIHSSRPKRRHFSKWY